MRGMLPYVAFFCKRQKKEKREGTKQMEPALAAAFIARFNL